ncbi:GNAT family N-acetyltransferase [Ancylobacter terrae]|uniref:GNAT family N-acetyltransferase n=1 Tax=Ancylobacter sp. sgz301288 TaxID=3342077 RepID=UPI00385DA560
MMLSRTPAARLDAAVIEIHTAIAPLEAEWRTLEESGHATAFQTYDFVAPLYAAFGRHGRAEPVIVVVRPTPGAAPVMILPLCRYREGGLDLIAFADIRVADYCAPVLAADFPAEDGAGFLALWKRIEKALPRADMIHLRKLTETVGEVPNPLLHLPGHVPFVARAHGVPIATPWREVAKERMSTNALSLLRRRERKLAAFGPLAFRFETGGLEAESLYETLAAQRLDRFARLGRDDLMREPMWSEFYRDIASGTTARACGSVFALTVGGEAIATGLGLVRGRSFLMIVMAFDMNRHSELAPGRLMLFRAMEALAEEGFDYFDLTIGDEPYKQSLGADDRLLREVARPLGFRGMIGTAAWRGKVFLRRYPGLKDKIKRLLRRN